MEPAEVARSRQCEALAAGRESGDSSQSTRLAPPKAFAKKLISAFATEIVLASRFSIRI